MVAVTSFVPGPALGELKSGPFGLRTLRALRADTLGFFVQSAREYADAAHSRVAGIHVFQLTHPELNHQVLVEKAASFVQSSRVKRVLGQWSGQGLALLDGETWRRQRRLAGAAFRPADIAARTGVVLRHARRLVDGWGPGREIQVSRDVQRCTLAVAAEALFGAELDAHSSTLISAVETINELAIAELQAPFVLPMWAPLPAKRRLRDAAGQLDAIVDLMIERCRAAQAGDTGLLGAIVGAVDEAGRGMSSTEARGTAINILLGAHETTAAAITWAMYCLSRHVEAQRAVAREIDAQGEISGPSLRRSSALQRVLLETLRLYPPAYVIPREAARDVELGAIRIPAGSFVNLVPYVTHRDPRWYPRPESFAPERFEAEQVPGAYLPFGLGPRACIGRGFALLEASAVLSTVLQRFELAPAPTQAEVELEAQISLHPRGGLRLVLANAATPTT